MKNRVVSVLAVLFCTAVLAACAMNQKTAETMAQPEQGAEEGNPGQEEAEQDLEDGRFLAVIENNDDCDAMMQQAYDLFLAQGPQALAAYDASEEVQQKTAMMFATGIDRYAYQVSEDRYAMLYLNAPTGGYWWYFGRMENGIRSGNGITVVVLPRGAYQAYAGQYLHDFPEGKGVLRFQNGLAYYELAGTFHGSRLNGTMKATLYNGITSSKAVKAALDYEDNHLKTPCDIAVDEGKEMFLFAYLDDGRYMGWENTTQALDTGFEVFMGNDNLLQK